MLPWWQRAIIGVAGLCFLAVPFVVTRQKEAALSPRPRRRVFSPSRSPTEAALGRAKLLWNYGQLGVKPELEALCEKAPFASDERQKEWRRRLLARDAGGELQLARVTARQALELAHSDHDRGGALTWLAIIECDLGLHREELQHVQRLVRLQPGSDAAWGAMRRAARCNHLEALQQQAERRLTALGSRYVPDWAD